MKIALLLLALLPVYSEDRSDESIAEHRAAVAAAVWENSQGKPLPPRDWTRLMLTVGFHESGFSKRIIAGKCKKHECDRGRAKGAWQIHANTLNRDKWRDQDGDLPLQAKLASEMLVRAYWTCARSGVEPVRGALNAFAGKRCGSDWPGLKARLATYGRLR